MAPGKGQRLQRSANLRVMVTDELINNVTEAWGQAGTDWLDRLPSLLSEVEERWSIRVDEPFDLSFNYVAPAVREDGTDVVLKLGVPDDDHRREEEALRLFNGRGAIWLLMSDPDRGAMMLERLKPGAYLGDLADREQATSIAAGVMKQLWRPAPRQHLLPGMSDYSGGLEWLQRQLDGTGPLPKPLVVQAEGMLRELVEQTNQPVVLHGDLHPWNILSAERERWLAIDPHGIVGDPAYELGPFIYSLPLPRDQPARVLSRRLDQLAEELGFERERIMNAVLPRAVLAAWSDESTEVWQLPLACAELLSEL